MHTNPFHARAWLSDTTNLGVILVLSWAVVGSRGGYRVGMHLSALGCDYNLRGLSSNCPHFVPGGFSEYPWIETTRRFHGAGNKFINKET